MEVPSTTFSQEFYEEFQSFHARIFSQLDSISGQNDDELVKTLSKDVNGMRRKLNDLISELPSYDRRSYENQLKTIEEQLALLQSRPKTKGRFAFRKANISASIKPDSSTTQRANQTALPMTLDTPVETKIWAYLTNTTLSDSSMDGALTISNLDHCVVNVVDSDLTAVHIRNVKNSLLLLGKVNGSLLAHDLENCTIFVSSHQLRIHSSRNALFFVERSANAIIEDCRGIMFAEYPTDSPKTDESVKVQDFSHIKSTPSQNWKFLSSDSGLLSEDDWISVLKVKEMDKSAIGVSLDKFLPHNS